MAPEAGELSADGRYRWDGKEWLAVSGPSEPTAISPAAQQVAPQTARVHVPVVQKVDLGAGAAFRLGFFAFFGAGCASIVFWIAGIIVVVALGGFGALLSGLGSHT